jgi:hypothetical protein
MATGQNRRHDRVQPVALAQQVLLEQEEPSKRASNVAKADQGQTDVANRPTGRFYACFTW